MRCPTCKEYVPEGFGLETCPACHADLPSASTPSKEPALFEPSLDQKTPDPIVFQQIPKTLVAGKQNLVFQFLFNFGYKRSMRAALGFWLVYTFLGGSFALLCGATEFMLFHGHLPPLLGIKGGQFLAPCISALIAILILKQKKRLLNPIDLIFAAIGIFVSFKVGMLPGFLIISLLTLRTNRGLSSSSMQYTRFSLFTKRGAWILMLFVVFTFLILGIFIPRGGHSYYVDDDETVGAGIPDNRVFSFNGSFFKVFLNYPQDMYAPVLGEEVFLTKGGSTHFLKLVVVNTEGEGLPVRYRVRSMTLSDSEKIYPFLLFHHFLYNDEIKKGIERHLPEEKLPKEALTNSSNILSNADFVADFNSALYFGYDLKNPPKRLKLNFEIEVYKLGDEPKKVIKQSIDLHRIDRDPMDWIKTQVRGKR